MLRFEWDSPKARTNLRKHGVTFEDAMRVFEDPFALFEQDRAVEGESRWQATGLAGDVILLLVAHAVQEDGELIRLISARRATRKERQRYDETRAQDAG